LHEVYAAQKVTLTPIPEMSSAHKMRPALVDRFLLNSKLKVHNAGEKPPMKPVFMEAKKQTLKKAKYFFHVGQRITSVDDGGTSTRFVPPNMDVVDKVHCTIRQVDDISIHSGQ
jgi:hypothetical protein